MIAEIEGTLQGGELDGVEGTYGLAGDKMVQLMGLGGAMLAHAKWGEFLMRHFVGKATFGVCTLGEIQEVQSRGSSASSNEAFDEVFLVLCMVPLMARNFKAPIDTLPPKGGAAVASASRRAPETVECAHDWCSVEEKVIGISLPS